MNFRSLGIAAAFLVGCMAFASAQPNVQNASSRQTALTNTAVTIKTGRTTVVGITCYNPNVETMFVQMYDTTGAVIVGTTTPKATQPINSTSVGLTTVFINATMLAAAKVAATTTFTGGTAPGAPLQCTFFFQ